jgi:DNA-binding FadR family transcriptional regulator
MPVKVTQPSEEYRPGYETVAERILNLIGTMDLKEGDRLPTEQELRSQLGVGHTVLREAVKMLVARGQVRVRRGSGIYVAATIQNSIPQDMSVTTMIIDPKDVISWFECRKTLEMQTARLAAERITPREMRGLEEAVELNRNGAAIQNYTQFDQGDNAFHKGIAEASHNPFLASLITSTTQLHLWVVELAVASSPDALLTSAEQHRSILAAIQSGKAEEAAEAMKRHLDTVAQAYDQEVRRRLMPDRPA